MKPVERFRRLIEDLKAHPARYFDYLSPLSLNTFLRGYEHGDPAFCDCASVAHDIVVARHPSAESISTGTILYLAVADLTKAYELYLSILCEVLNNPENDVEPSEYSPLQTSLTLL